MKRFLKILLGLAVIASAGFGAVMYMTSGMVKSANTFLQDLAQSDLAEAKTMLSQRFCAKLNDAKLTKFAAESGLGDYKEASWPNRKISGNRGTMSGTVSTTTGATNPIKMVLVKGSGVWKVSGMYQI